MNSKKSFLSLFVSFVSFACFLFPAVSLFVYMLAEEETGTVLSFVSILPLWPLGSWTMDKSLEAEFYGLKLPRYSNKKVGGIRFIRLGRFVFSYAISRGTKKRVRNLPSPSRAWVNPKIKVLPRWFTYPRPRLGLTRSLESLLRWFTYAKPGPGLTQP